MLPDADKLIRLDQFMSILPVAISTIYNRRYRGDMREDFLVKVDGRKHLFVRVPSLIDYLLERDQAAVARAIVVRWRAVDRNGLRYAKEKDVCFHPRIGVQPYCYACLEERRRAGAVIDRWTR